MSFGFWNPWSDDLYRDLRREMDTVFSRHGGARAARGGPFPPVNLYETPDDYVLTAEVPGVAKDALEVSVEASRVTLRGERRIEHPDDGRTSLHRRERESGVFRRAVELPGPTDSDKAEAVYRNGVLMLRIPKAAETKPRRIQVQSS